jgi:hypothetical protein
MHALLQDLVEKVIGSMSGRPGEPIHAYPSSCIKKVWTVPCHIKMLHAGGRLIKFSRLESLRRKAQNAPCVVEGAHWVEM